MTEIRYNRKGDLMWPDAMVRDLALFYPDKSMPLRALAALFKERYGVVLSTLAIRHKARHIGLVRTKATKRPVPWASFPGATEVLRDLYQQGVEDPAIADALNAQFGMSLTRQQVGRRRRVIGLVRYRQNRWPEKADTLLRRSLEQGRHVDDIVRSLNKACRMKLTRLAVLQHMNQAGLRASEATGDPSISDAARLLKVKAGTLWRWIRMKQYRTYGEGRCRFISPDVMEQLRADWPPVNEPTMSPQEARSQLFFDESRIYQLLEEGKLRGIRRGTRWHITVASVDAYRRTVGIARPLAQTFGGKVA